MNHVVRAITFMNEDARPHASSSWQNQAHLTAIVGHAQLLQRWVTRTEGLTELEREGFVRHLLAIERAATTLHEELPLPEVPTSET